MSGCATYLGQKQDEELKKETQEGGNETSLRKTSRKETFPPIPPPIAKLPKKIKEMRHDEYEVWDAQQRKGL